MGFLIFTILLAPAMLLYGLVQMIVEWLLPILTPLKPFLEYLLSPEGFNAVMGILLGVNLLILAVLLVLLITRKRSTGNPSSLRRFGAALVKIVLILGTVWESLVVLLCALCLVIQPLQYLSADRAGPQDPGHFLWGIWEVVSCAAVTPSCPLTQEEIDGYIGTQVFYGGYDYKRNGEVYTKTDVFLIYDTDYQITSVACDDIRAEEFEDMFQLSLSGLGYEGPVVTHAVVHFQKGKSLDLPGQEIFCAGNLMWLYHQGALFRLEEALFYGGPLIDSP